MTLPYLEDTTVWWIVDPKEFIRHHMEMTGCTHEDAIRHWCEVHGLTYIPPDERSADPRIRRPQRRAKVSRVNDILRWQREFNSAPKVYVTMNADGDISNLYESREAAQLEVNWRRNRGRLLRVRVEAMPIHTLKLSRERWQRLADHLSDDMGAQDDGSSQ